MWFVHVACPPPTVWKAGWGPRLLEATRRGPSPALQSVYLQEPQLPGSLRASFPLASFCIRRWGGLPFLKAIFLLFSFLFFSPPSNWSDIFPSWIIFLPYTVYCVYTLQSCSQHLCWKAKYSFSHLINEELDTENISFYFWGSRESQTALEF